MGETDVGDVVLHKTTQTNKRLCGESVPLHNESKLHLGYLCTVTDRRTKEENME